MSAQATQDVIYSHVPGFCYEVGSSRCLGRDNGPVRTRCSPDAPTPETVVRGRPVPEWLTECASYATASSGHTAPSSRSTSRRFEESPRERTMAGLDDVLCVGSLAG
jgi:hypothetical protein